MFVVSIIGNKRQLLRSLTNFFVLCFFVSVFGLDRAQTTIDFENVLEKLTNKNVLENDSTVV